MSFQTLNVRIEPPVCFIRIERPDAGNSINRGLVEEFQRALTECDADSIHVVVVEGAPDVFCAGADFSDYSADENNAVDPQALYDVWERLASGPFISVAHVQGKATAGGVGFAAACDVVLASRAAQFSLTELLFGLYPACVLPFLARRVGFQRAHYMTLTTKPVSADQALQWGLADECDVDSEALLRKLLLRLRRLPKAGIRNYKAYASSLNPIVAQSCSSAVAANRELFADPVNRATVRRFVESGLFPWEE
jgi:polyketide biosynthesis enoyl-CoA hydratase PksH